MDIDAFQPNGAPAEDFYLSAGELVTYKRADLLIEAFNASGRKLVVVGDGPDRARLEKSANPNITFLGRVSDEALADHYARCRALVFPGVEDFGIVPLEVMASGRPVVAFGSGGALETVEDGVTGLFFHEPTVEALNDALERLEAQYDQMTPRRIRAHAARFSRARFRAEFGAFVASKREQCR